MAARGGGAAATTKSTIVAEVKRLMREGKTRAEIIAATGCSRQMYAYASKTLVRKPKPLGRPIKYP